MSNEPITLDELIEIAQECDGRVTVVDAIYDDVRDVTYFDTAHNLEMFFACVGAADDPEITIDDVIDDPGYLDEIGYYGVYAYLYDSDNFHDAVPVTDCSISDGRLILFV